MERSGPRCTDPGLDPAWQDPVLVVCPRCEGLAVARRRERWTARLVCGGCGLTRDGQGTEPHTEEGVDARFGTPLWLRATCCGGKLLWANNEAHLDYLEAFVGARLREHASGPAPLSAKLPGWMKDAKNRDEVLRHLGRLRQRLDGRSIPVRGAVDREPNDHTDVVVGEFRDDQGRSLLVIDETC